MQCCAGWSGRLSEFKSAVRLQNIGIDLKSLQHCKLNREKKCWTFTVIEVFCLISIDRHLAKSAAIDTINQIK